VLHIGERSETLLPKDPKARVRSIQWLIAALNSIEPFAMNLASIDLFYADQEWAKLRRPGAEALIRQRLASHKTSHARPPAQTPIMEKAHDASQ
jgi:glutathione S-transferase